MKRFLLLLSSVALLSSPVGAQDEVASALPEDVSSLLVPTGAWLVGPTTLTDGSSAEGGMPCVMVNKFSNNMELRLSGGGEEILALALNVGAPSFTIDQNYLMIIAFEGEAPLSLPAQAFSEDTVVVGTEPGKDFYNLLKNKQAMTIKLGESALDFSLLGVAQSLKRLESCFKPQDAATMAAPSDITTTTEGPVMAASPVPAAALPAADAQAAPAEAAKVATKEAQPAGIHSLDQVSAQKVNQLMEEIKGKTAPAADTATPTPTPEASPPTPAPALVKSQDILTPGTATAVTGEGQQMRWRVMKGANLQNILEVWAASAQARLIWKAGQTFSIPESLAMQGHVEAAVEAVLAQFPQDGARPVGKIYQDAAAQQKVLVIETVSQPAATGSPGNYAPIISP